MKNKESNRQGREEKGVDRGTHRKETSEEEVSEGEAQCHGREERVKGLKERHSVMGGRGRLRGNVSKKQR